MERQLKRNTLLEFDEHNLNKSSERSTSDLLTEKDQGYSTSESAQNISAPPGDEPSNRRRVRGSFSNNYIFPIPEAAFPRGSLLQMPRDQRPWDLYRPVIEVRQGCPAIMAARRSGDLKRYAISTVSASHKEKYLQALQKLQLSRTSTLVNIVELMDWKGGFSMVSDYINVCLAQILACQKTLEEPEVAFILNEVPTAFLGRKPH